MKVRWTTSVGWDIDPKITFRREDEGTGVKRMIPVDPVTGEDLTPERQAELVAEREANRHTTYSVEFWTQPWHRWAAMRVYDWYHGVTDKIPGLSRLADRFVKDDGGFGIGALPWCALQDMRCYDLGRKGRVDLGRVDVNEELYNKLSKASNNGLF